MLPTPTEGVHTPFFQARPMAWPAVVLVLGLALLLLPLSGSACSCARETLAEQSARAALVVEAEVLAHWSGPQWTRTLLRVDRVRQGAWTRPLLLVRHRVSPAACGLTFPSGARYTLTFPHWPGGPEAPLRINHCRVWPARPAS